MRHLRACVRLQFHRDFTFDHLIPLLDYFAELGISHIYASPILKARPGSTHGYDVVDPGQVNPELGGEAALERLVHALRRHGMGLIVDFVPNHMAVGGSDNPWWLDVLEWGARSPFAKFFDIQWNSPDPLLTGQPLVPFLRTDYGEALNSGEIQLHFDAATGSFYAAHFDHRFPLCPTTYNEILDLTLDESLKSLSRRFGQLDRSANYWHEAPELQRQLSIRAEEENLREQIALALKRFNVEPADGNATSTAEAREQNVQRFHQLLELQHYRLASWRAAADDINWRRFFDINELAGLRMEHAEVFAAVHKKMFDLIQRGLIDGLRLDHIDGLANPRAYCRQLRRQVTDLLRQRPASRRKLHFPIYVEKILAGDEQLATHWRVDGTTGYEFMNQVSLVQHQDTSAESLAGVWQQISGRSANFREEILEARRLVLTTSLSGDFESVAQNLLLIARTHINTRDFTLVAIRRALLELIAHFPVYRTYVTGCPRSPQDERYFSAALDGARSVLGESDGPLLDQLNLWLGGEPLYQLPPDDTRELRRKTLARFQQLTSATAAKAVEDTACYRSAVLLSRNDVGFDPWQMSAPVDDFHHQCRARQHNFPLNLLTTATHDHKRGEDTRARLTVLSEKPEWFIDQIGHWRLLAQSLRQELDDGQAPSAGDELVLYQTLVASWPLDLSPEDTSSEKMSDYLQRLKIWQEKALREAKLRTHWSSPNAAYEAACQNFLTALLSDDSTQELRNGIAEAAMALAPAGAINGLAQSLLRMTTPGVPDLYQGAEFWDYSLVDPDNRRPVDFAERTTALQRLHGAGEDILPELLRCWHDGHIKQFLIWKTLNCRRELPELFSLGEYHPVAVEGDEAERVIAFLRRKGPHVALIVVPRLPAGLLEDVKVPLIPADRWGNTRLRLPGVARGLDMSGAHGWQSLFSPARTVKSEWLLRDLLADFPVNVFLGNLPVR